MSYSWKRYNSCVTGCCFELAWDGKLAYVETSYVHDDNGDNCQKNTP